MAKAASQQIGDSSLWRKFSESLSILRPRNALGPVLAFCIAYAAGSSGLNDFNQAIQGVLVIFLVHSIATVQNDIRDLVIDKANGRHSVLIDGRISSVQATSLLKILLVGLIIAIVFSGMPVHNLLFAILFGFLAWSYNTPPLQLSRKPIGSIVLLGVTMGLLPTLYAAALSGWLGVSAFALAGGFFFWRCSTSILKDYKDCSGDKKYNKRTFLVVYGKKATFHVSLVLSALGACIISVWVYSYTSMPTGVAISLSFSLFVLVFLRIGLQNGSYSSLNNLFHKILNVTAAVELLMVLCLLQF